jgi:hypothetical protein
MGTPSSKKFLKNVAGTLTEETAVTTSAGAGDADKIPALDSSGRLDQTMMPTGITPDTASVISSENLADGDLVNIWNDAGTPKVRKADATTAGKRAHGFVLASSVAPAAAIVYFEGTNAHVSGLTAGDLFLSTTAGQSTAIAPSTAGNTVQRVGLATAAASMNFEAGDPITLA